MDFVMRQKLQISPTVRSSESLTAASTDGATETERNILKFRHATSICGQRFDNSFIFSLDSMYFIIGTITTDIAQPFQAYNGIHSSYCQNKIVLKKRHDFSA